MNTIAQISTGIAALVLVAVFPIESFLIARPWVQKVLGVGPLNSETASHVHLWSFNIGARNALAGIGALIGLAIYHYDDAPTGTTVVVVCLVYMLASSLFMGICDALGFWKPRGGSVRGTVGSSILPAIALVAIAA